jgi:hypothetical protein
VLGLRIREIRRRRGLGEAFLGGVPPNKGLDLTVGRVARMERPPAGQSRCSADVKDRRTKGA